MTAIKEVPTNFRVYYASMKNAYTQKREEAVTVLQDLNDNLKDTYFLVSSDFENNKKDFPINLNDYKEYNENKYIDGQFLRVAKGVLANRNNNYELVGRNFDIYRLAKLQKDIYLITKDIAFYDKILSIPCKQYGNILKLYYTTVQKKLIVDACGYAFEGQLGWLCINRCKNLFNRTHIDYAATKKRKEQLKAEGKRIYNKEEAEWCERNGIEYKAEDGRVMQNMEYFYEIPLLGCKIPNGSSIKFESSDYRSHKLRGKTNGDILEESGGDINKICDYDVDIRTKLNICLQADKTLYAKFIRNENQETSLAGKVNRKS